MSLVEHLAHQFTSPVRWIETHDPSSLSTTLSVSSQLDPLPPSPAWSLGRSSPLPVRGRSSCRRCIAWTRCQYCPHFRWSKLLPLPSPATSIEDTPIKSLEILTVIVAQKSPCPNPLKSSLAVNPLCKTKSSGTLVSLPASGKGEELSAALGVGFSGNLDKYTTGLVLRIIGGKLQPWCNKSYLSKSWGLGP